MSKNVVAFSSKKSLQFLQGQLWTHVVHHLQSRWRLNRQSPKHLRNHRSLGNGMKKDDRNQFFKSFFDCFFFADTWCTWCIHVLIKSWRVEYLLRCFVAWGVRQERQDEEEDVEVEQPVVAEMPATAAIPQIAVLDDDGDAGDADGQDLIARDQVHQGNGCFF